LAWLAQRLFESGQGMGIEPDVAPLFKDRDFAFSDNAAQFALAPLEPLGDLGCSEILRLDH
jgi:hypothetical protein